MRLQAEKLQADMERNEKFVSEAWEALKAAEEQRHCRGDEPERSGNPTCSRAGDCAEYLRHS